MKIDDLLAEGVELFVQAMTEQRAGLLRFKLSAPAYAKACVEVADTTPARLTKLTNHLEHPRWIYVRKLVEQLISCMITPECGHPLNPIQIDNLLDGFDGASAQVAKAGYSRDELMAVAAQIATQRHPDKFGLIDDPDSHERKLIGRKARIKAIEQAIERAVTLADCVIDPNDLSEWQQKHGIQRRCLKAWPEVYLDPVNTLGSRLIAHVGQSILTKRLKTPDWITPERAAQDAAWLAETRRVIKEGVNMSDQSREKYGNMPAQVPTPKPGARNKGEEASPVGQAHIFSPGRLTDADLA